MKIGEAPFQARGARTPEQLKEDMAFVLGIVAMRGGAGGPEEGAWEAHVEEPDHLLEGGGGGAADATKPRDCVGPRLCRASCVLTTHEARPYFDKHSIPKLRPTMMDTRVGFGGCRFRRSTGSQLGSDELVPPRRPYQLGSSHWAAPTTGSILLDSSCWTPTSGLLLDSSTANPSWLPRSP